MITIEVFFLVLYASPILFNGYNQILASRVIFNGVVLAHIFFLSLLLGNQSNVYLFFIPTIMAPFVLFEFTQRRIIIIFTALNIILASVLFAGTFRDFESPVKFSLEEITILNKIFFYSGLACCAAIIYSLLYLNEKTTRQLDFDKETLRVQIESIFDNSIDALFLVNNSKRKIVKANNRAVEMFEAETEADFLNKYGLDLHKNYPTDDEITGMRKTLVEQGIFESEILYKTFLGNEFWGALSVKLIDINGEKFQSVRLTNISEQKKAKEQTDASLKEKELLLGEIHHRVKNNLAIISALINLQIENLKDDESKTIFEETKDRIYSMALIHNQLYQNKSFAQIEFAQYISNFCSYLTKSYQTNPIIEIVERTEKIFLDIKTAIPCALILNELITNAFKHAFKTQLKGKIEIGLRKEHKQVLFYVSDTGSGMDIQQLQSNSMGMSLITSLIEQIDGKLEYKNQNGSLFSISFPLEGR